MSDAIFSKKKTFQNLLYNSKMQISLFLQNLDVVGISYIIQFTNFFA